MSVFFVFYSFLPVTQPRDDYCKILELVLMFLEYVPHRGVHYVAPGPVHNARWMSKVLHALKVCVHISIAVSSYYLWRKWTTKDQCVSLPCVLQSIVCSFAARFSTNFQSDPFTAAFELQVLKPLCISKWPFWNAQRRSPLVSKLWVHCFGILWLGSVS